MKYASNYFLSFVRRLLACLSCITLPRPLAELAFAHAPFSFSPFLFLVRV